MCLIEEDEKEYKKNEIELENISLSELLKINEVLKKESKLESKLNELELSNVKIYQYNFPIIFDPIFHLNSPLNYCLLLYY